MKQFCSKCGSVIVQETGACPKCAEETTRFVQVVEANQLPLDVFKPQPKKTKNKKAIILGVVAVAVILALLLGIFGIVGNIKGNNLLPDSYDEIIEEYKLVVEGKTDDTDDRLSNILTNKLNEEENYEICYSLTDINDDETEELIIGGRLADDEDAETFDIYTMDEDEKAVQLFDVNNFSEEKEIKIYDEVVQTSEEKEEYSHIEYLRLPENQWKVEKVEEYLYEDGKYFEIIDDEKNEISKETFEEADKKYDGTEIDLEWVKVVIEKDYKEKDTAETETTESTTKANTFDGKKYIGKWGAHYLSNGIYDYTLDIKSVDGNKLTMDVFFYRIVGFDDQVVTVDEKGIAHFKMPGEGSSDISGTMKFSDDTIDMIFDDFTTETYRGKRFVFEKLGGASTHNIFQHIGKGLEEITKLFGNGEIDYMHGGKFMASKEADAIFYYEDGTNDELVLTIMAFGEHDYGCGLSCNKTYSELKSSTSKYFDLPKPKEIYSEMDQMTYYCTNVLYGDCLIEISWYGQDPYTHGADEITFNPIPEDEETLEFILGDY